MPRVQRGVTAHRRHKKILKKAKGYYGARSRVFRVAKQAVTKQGSTPIAIAGSVSASSARCGLPASTRSRVPTG